MLQHNSELQLCSDSTLLHCIKNPKTWSLEAEEAKGRKGRYFQQGSWIPFHKVNQEIVSVF